MINLNFNAPFPFINSSKSKILTSVIFGAFVFTFLYVFQPFGIQNIKSYKTLFLLGYAVITSGSMAFGFFFIPLFMRRQVENWTIQKMLFFIFFKIVLISGLNWAYHYFLHQYYHDIFRTLRYYSLSDYFLITLSVGVFPSSLILFWLERQMRTINQEIAHNLDIVIQSKRNENAPLLQTMVVLGEFPHELEINPNDLISIKSDGNYAEVYLQQKKGVKYKLIRCPISILEKQLSQHPFINRCHRSYIVNFNHIIKVTGNARNYNLHFEGLDFSVPVSRSYPAETIKRLKSIKT